MRYFLEKSYKRTHAVLVRTGLESISHFAVIQKYLFKQKFRPKYALKCFIFWKKARKSPNPLLLLVEWNPVLLHLSPVTVIFLAPLQH